MTASDSLVYSAFCGVLTSPLFGYYFTQLSLKPRINLAPVKYNKAPMVAWRIAWLISPRLHLIATLECHIESWVITQMLQPEYFWIYQAWCRFNFLQQVFLLLWIRSEQCSSMLICPLPGKICFVSTEGSQASSASISCSEAVPELANKHLKTAEWPKCS